MPKTNNHDLWRNVASEFDRLETGCDSLLSWRGGIPTDRYMRVRLGQRKLPFKHADVHYEWELFSGGRANLGLDFQFKDPVLSRRYAKVLEENKSVIRDTVGNDFGVKNEEYKWLQFRVTVPLLASDAGFPKQAAELMATFIECTLPLFTSSAADGVSAIE